MRFLQFLRFRSLESRIGTLFLILILFIQLIGYIAIQSSIAENAKAATHDDLVIGGRVFQRLLDQNAQKLTQNARLLAFDFPFRTAIGQGDKETIESVLMNAGQRINASNTLFVGTDRAILAASGEKRMPSLERAVLSLADQAEQSGSSVGVTIIDNLPYQLVVVPVKAPLVIGWVAMSFPIDQTLADDTAALSHLNITIMTKAPSGEWVPGASTLKPTVAATLAAALSNREISTEYLAPLNLNDDQYSARIMKVNSLPGQTAVVVLQRSLGEAVAPYRKLQINLIILTGVAILIAVLGSFFTARRITGPLRQLGEIAKRLGTGHYEGSISLMRNDEVGDLSKAFERMRDDIAAREVEVRRLAYWDALTNLPNRIQFTNLLVQAIEKASADGSECYILMMDLDRFKNVNDVLGHSFGDALLCQLAERLKNHVKHGRDHVARLGGDEFAILLPGTSQLQAREVASRILKALEVPMSLEGQTVDLGAGIGIAGFPEHGGDAQTLLSRVEVAMYAAKKSSTEAVIYEPRIDKSSQEGLSLLSELRQAIDQDQFRLYVQPKTDLSSGDVVGIESLVRWQHPQKGMIYPDNFIPFSERTGFVRLLTSWMMDRSAALCKELGAQGLTPKICVNLSTRDLLDQELPAQFAAILARHGVAPSSFCLEITESAIMDDPVRAQQTLEGLAAMDFELAIDDFGTGYSSLAYLKRLPVDELKIDKSFVMKMETDLDDRKIVRSTIDLGHNMGLRVVAEGIENEAVWKLLANMGCDQGQGYFMARPMPADQFSQWQRKWSAAQHAPERKSLAC